jgi:hypothetical protein
MAARSSVAGQVACTVFPILFSATNLLGGFFHDQIYSRLFSQFF